jgi:hypothetical protein
MTPRAVNENFHRVIVASLEAQTDDTENTTDVHGRGERI